MDLHRRRLIRIPVVAAGSAAGLLLLGGSTALAHVTIAETEQVAGAFTVLTVGVPHGCDGSPTTEVRIQMPESIPQVAPTINQGWDVEKVMEKLDEPLDVGEGETITERVSEVVYTAKVPLPEGYRDAFELSVRIPDDAAGQTLYFPTVQTGEEGDHPWIEIPEAGQSPFELESPSPFINVVAAEEEGATPTTATATSAAPATTAVPASTAAAGTTVTPADDESDDDADSSSTGLSIAALVVGAAGLGVGGTALARQRRR